MTLRHRLPRLRRLIETGEVEEGKAGVERDKKKCTKRMSAPSDARTVLPILVQSHFLADQAFDGKQLDDLVL